MYLFFFWLEYSKFIIQFCVWKNAARVCYLFFSFLNSEAIFQIFQLKQIRSLRSTDANSISNKSQRHNTKTSLQSKHTKNGDSNPNSRFAIRCHFISNSIIICLPLLFGSLPGLRALFLIYWLMSPKLSDGHDRAGFYHFMVHLF